ncbi:DUF5590 domain-containing protein [Alkalicoccus halolimnae]|uniref:DUF5590 domain-containing protein n=1 Tax=Alkalicoccus halolimnae TaxID=1667239 RepID=A0A5C7FGY9_9BACI|nr:DUF5590 domain-containing protein [Alkalicoccus halolimnae]TXF82973.1 hypothetical protein FTX54_13300 [Alkalicoccus halolimnae]
MKHLGLYIFLASLVVITGFVYFYFSSILSPLEARQEAAVENAMEEADIQEVKNVDYFHGSRSYQVIDAVTNEDEAIYVLVEETESETDPVILPHSEGISFDEAAAAAGENSNIAELKSVKIGLMEDTPVYEIHYADPEGRLSYYYVTFANGEYVRSYQLSPA